MYKETIYKKRIHRNRPFLLIGNQIDGRLFCDELCTFETLSDLKENLEMTISNIKGEGEWTFELYQVPKNYRIWFRWGYFKYPSRGIKLFTYSYMSLPIKVIEFKHNEISFIGSREDDFNFFTANEEKQISRVVWDWV